MSGWVLLLVGGALWLLHSRQIIEGTQTTAPGAVGAPGGTTAPTGGVSVPPGGGVIVADDPAPLPPAVMPPVVVGGGSLPTGFDWQAPGTSSVWVPGSVQAHGQVASVAPLRLWIGTQGSVQPLSIWTAHGRTDPMRLTAVRPGTPVPPNGRWILANLSLLATPGDWQLDDWKL